MPCPIAIIVSLVLPSGKRQKEARKKQDEVEEERDKGDVNEAFTRPKSGPHAELTEEVRSLGVLMNLVFFVSCTNPSPNRAITSSDAETIRL